MRNPSLNPRRLLLLVAAAATLALSACSQANSGASATQSVDAIYTEAFHTLTAQRATQLALTPSATPSPLPSPTLAPSPAAVNTVPPVASPNASPVATGAGACDFAVFVNDVTIPDGTVEAPGKNFVKTWLLMNKGTCDWTTAYKLVLVGGDTMGGSSVPLPSAVPAGQQVQVSVSLIAPTQSGNYTGTWQLQNPQGQNFGDQVTVVIKVGNGGGTGGASATATP